MASLADFSPRPLVGLGRSSTLGSKQLPGATTIFVERVLTPADILKRILQIGTDPKEHDLVLDFFAGYCSTAHALFALNREDAGNRRFICVQLPESSPQAGIEAEEAHGCR